MYETLLSECKRVYTTKKGLYENRKWLESTASHNVECRIYKCTQNIISTTNSSQMLETVRS